MKIKYMHTIDGCPGSYYPGEQICFAVRSRPIRLADSLAQIKKERRATLKWRRQQSYNIYSDYGHLRVQI
jgi:hypothetical protein